LPEKEEVVMAVVKSPHWNEETGVCEKHLIMVIPCPTCAAERDPDVRVLCSIVEEDTAVLEGIPLSDMFPGTSHGSRTSPSSTDPYAGGKENTLTSSPFRDFEISKFQNGPEFCPEGGRLFINIEQFFARLQPGDYVIIQDVGTNVTFRTENRSEMATIGTAEDYSTSKMGPIQFVAGLVGMVNGVLSHTGRRLCLSTAVDNNRQEWHTITEGCRS